MSTDSLVAAAEAAPAIPAASSGLAEALVESRARLFRVALLLLGRREDAEDATHRTIVRALETGSAFRGASEPYTWLYRILVNVCKDHRKALSRAGYRFQALEVAGADARPSGEPSGLDALVARERDERVRAALDALEPRAREILVLRHYEDLSYADIAVTLGVPVGTVRSRLSAARARMRDALARLGAAR